VIDKPGSYVLGGNRMISASMSNIHITAPDVTLDLNGFVVSHQAGIQGGSGIAVSAPENVEIRNGSVVNSPYAGINAATGKGFRVIGVRVASAKNGMLVSAVGSLIEGCFVADATNYGIYVNGTGSIITDCVVSGSSYMGIATGAKGIRVVRATVHGGATGVALHSSNTLVDSIVTGATTRGVIAQPGCTLRNVEVMQCPLGLQSYGAFVAGSSITDNTTGVSGIYINGGNNFIQ
jgi:hypothetical protein